MKDIDRENSRLAINRTDMDSMASAASKADKEMDLIVVVDGDDAVKNPVKLPSLSGTYTTQNKSVVPENVPMKPSIKAKIF